MFLEILQISQEKPLLKCLFHRAGLPLIYSLGLHWYLCFSLCIIIYGFVCKSSFHCYWYCYNQKQSSGGVLQKMFLTNFAKHHKKIPELKDLFLWSCRSPQFNFINKDSSTDVFLQILQNFSQHFLQRTLWATAST